MIERLERRIANCRNPQTGQILIVGDRPAKGVPMTPERFPFCSTTQCSGWLNAQLTISEDKLRWINSADINGVPTPFEELQKLLPAKMIIALGGNAAKWLKSHQVFHFHQTYHPQYWKRFRSKERYPLLDILERAMREVA